MSSVQETVDVDVPVSTAYNQWTQFESFPYFMEGVESVVQLDDTHSRWVTKVAGVRREFDTEITEQRADKKIAWRTVGGDVEHAGVVTFQPLSVASTRVAIQLDWSPQGVAEKAGAAAQVDDRQVKADAKRFKEFIEERGRETGAWRGEVTR
jgi:uncharacterized membrane protein